MAKRILSLFLILISLPAHVMAADGVGIVAKVNDDIITSYEMEQRISMAMSANNIPRTDEARKGIASQVLRSAIDDKLRIQAAKDAGIEITDEEIRRGLATVAGNNNVSVDDFLAKIATDGIERQTMEEQIRAELAWSKYVEMRILPRVNIADAEVDILNQQIQNSANQESYLLAEILLPVDTPADEQKVFETGKSLIEQMRGGAKFSALARNFSAASSASRSGDMGWLTMEQIPSDIAPFVRVMRAGQVSKPMRTERGYYIIFLRDQRKMSADNLPSRDQLQETAARQQLDILQRRELRELKSKAFIEVKG